MTRQSCSHGSASRLELHLYWCAKCSEWRWYRYANSWTYGRRGAIGTWGVHRLLTMGSMQLQQTETEELLAWARQLLIACQAIDAETRAESQAGGVRRLNARITDDR